MLIGSSITFFLQALYLRRKKIHNLSGLQYLFRESIWKKVSIAEAHQLLLDGSGFVGAGYKITQGSQRVTS